MVEVVAWLTNYEDEQIKIKYLGLNLVGIIICLQIS